MITQSEIEQKSQEFDIHTSDVQRDYIFSWVLVGLYTISELQKHLVLKGGNCLRKAYFENTRFSSDLDFSTQSGLSTQFIATELNKVCDFIFQKTGIVFDKDRIRVGEKNTIIESKKIYEARIYFKDFYGNESKIIISVRMDITQFEKLYLPVQKRYIIHPYSDYESCCTELACVKLEELLATKLKCLLQRRHSSDFYDYAHSIMFDHSIDINKSEIVSTFLKITIFERTPGFAKKLFVELPFVILKDLWSRFIVAPKKGIILFENAVESFTTHINEIFGSFRESTGEFHFFPPQYRNAIMEAGYSMTMLQVSYDGVTRLVEPYSLTYKVRQDGVGREYFYVWDRTGGLKSGPGIKTFVHQKIRSISNTQEKFEPRFDVELNKAGEYSKNAYFGQAFSGRKISSTRPKRSRPTRFNSKVIYIYQCPTCRKKFRKVKMNAQLNLHKDKYGNRCFGRHGFFISTKY